MNILRRLPLSRLLLLCGLVIAVGVSATALASALGSAPTPPPKPLAASSITGEELVEEYTAARSGTPLLASQDSSAPPIRLPRSLGDTRTV